MSSIFFFNIPAHGHTNPTLALVRELVKRGEDVTYYSTEAFRQKIEATGATFRDYGLDRNPDMAEISGKLFRLAALLIKLSEMLIPRILDEVREAKPDYIIHDSMCLWGKHIAQIWDVPAISSVSTFAFGQESNRASVEFILQTLKMLLTSIPYLLKYRRTAWALRRAYDIKPASIIDAFSNREALNIVYTSRQFQPGGDAFDDSFKFVGPSIAPRDDAGDFPFDNLAEKPLIYISMGTIFNDRVDFYQTCFEAFGDGDCQVIMSVGRRVDMATLGNIPDNFIVRNFVPQLEVLQRADLFVTHGGMNSVHEGLYYGVPLLVIPQSAEQGFVASRVAGLEAGIYLRSKDVSAQTLKDTAERMLSASTFRQNSREIGASLEAAGGYARAADEILAFKARYNIV